MMGDMESSKAEEFTLMEIPPLGHDGMGFRFLDIRGTIIGSVNVGATRARWTNDTKDILICYCGEYTESRWP